MRTMITRKVFVINMKRPPGLHLRRFLTEIDSIRRVLIKDCGVRPDAASDHVKQFKLEKLRASAVARSIDFCKGLGYSTGDLMENPGLLRCDPLLLEQHYLVMRESGFVDLRPSVLVKFRTHGHKPISRLKADGLIDGRTDVVGSLVSYLNPRPGGFCVNLKDVDGSNWMDVHKQILLEYLRWRLDASEQQVENMTKMHSNILRKSFQYLSENFQMAYDLGFTNEKILTHGFVLHAYPKYTKESLEKFPEIAGVPMRRAMWLVPKLVSRSPDSIEEICNLLKEHGISNASITRSLTVFLLSTDTVRRRLGELKTHPNFKVCVHHPGIMKLIVHNTRAKSRLAYLKKLQLKCAGLTLLGNSEPLFDNHVKGGRDVHSYNDVFTFIEGEFKRDKREFEDTLKRHPYFLQVPLTSMANTYECLLGEGFSNDSIFEVIYVLLYPREKVEEALRQVDDVEKARGPIDQATKLNLVLYFIEKEFHFSGDGVWTKEDQPLEESAGG